MSRLSRVVPFWGKLCVIDRLGPKLRQYNIGVVALVDSRTVAGDLAFVDFPVNQQSVFLDILATRTASKKRRLEFESVTSSAPARHQERRAAR